MENTLSEHIDNVREFCKLAGQVAPEQLTMPSDDIRLLRVKLTIEEALEQAQAFGVIVSPRSLVGEPIESINDLDFIINVNQEVDPVAVMDSAVDLLWVGVTGPAVCLGLSHKLEDCILEVDSSNMSKFIDGYKDPDSGKWIKGISYEPADLESIIYDGN